jgi:uncharacterized protein (DUF433 family)
MSDYVYTPAQASAVADLSLKTVHKLIDGRLIHTQRTRVGKETQRFLSQEQLVYLRLEAEGVRLLPLAIRREIAKAIENSPGIDVVAVSEGSALLVQVKSVRLEVEQQLVRLRKAQQMAISDPEIMQGTPVYQRTRIPVELVSEMLAEGASVEEILDGYPALDREKVELAPLYMRAFPRRGRPVRRPWAQQKPVRVTRHSRVLAR